MIRSGIAKVLAVVLAVFVFCGTVPQAAISASAEGTKIVTASLDYYASSTISQKPSAQREALGEYLNTELKNYVAEIDISMYNIPYTDEGVAFLSEILSGDLPECFHIASQFSFTVLGQKIIHLAPEYEYTKQQYKAMYTECMTVVNKLLSGIKGNDNLSEMGKALLLHDRLAVLCEYDEENYENKSIPRVSYTMYGVLSKNVAVCQGYALTYGYLLDQVGIENYYCSSVKLNHAWNIVYIGGKPYHVDVTWDDMVWDITGRVNHDNFLRSTAGIRASGHNAYDFDSTPTDTTYDDAFWQNSAAEFVLLNNDIYYIDNEEDHIIRCSDDKVIYDITAKWWADSTHIWADQARLSTDGKDLLFSLADGIYKLDMETGRVKAIYKPRLNVFWGVFGFTLRDGNLVCDIYFTPNFDGNTKRNYEVVVPYTSSQAHTPGNINDDGEVNLSDVVVLAQNMAGWDVSCNAEALDVNGDLSVDLQDVVHLAQYVAGWNVIIY